ncbi:hypothetical protein LCGC14_0249530 [marine sediment metagenome]|uniref:Nucleotide-diphospho-sugar transferase domain-containing protein n=1 Tax=marine sediment metagenome TaxID=412755 RepID=A0A0F9U582_9ZZZZ
MTKRRVMYLETGPAHFHNLVVSMWSLRKHCDVPILLYAWPQSYEVAKQIAEDDRLGIEEVIEWVPDWMGGGTTAQSECKQQIIQTIDADVVLYLDADTLVVDSLWTLFEGAWHYGFCGAQFNKWITTGKKISKRIRNLRQFPEIDKDLIDRLLAIPWPATNSGIFACDPKSPVIPKWYEYTVAARKSFIPDENCLYLMMPLFKPFGNMAVLEGGAWNSSTHYQDPDLKDEDVVIWHFHGDSNTRPKKSPKGVELWWPAYQECVKENVGNIQSWRESVRNKHLDRLLRKRSL